ncbi:MAG: 30S ribosomal protein S16 [Bacteroidales bacterium]|jgi:small subunit ribosomal protein S16|nr:30S ribosomal protein S16 [Bacteroidales bacterium]
MPAKIRLSRHGKKGAAFYHIVVADGRAPRDGKFIEKIGTYNPVHNPAEINLDAEKALKWLQNGAQPTDTVRSILSFTGVLYKNHLMKGVQKGALTEAQAEVKLQAWLKEKEAKQAAKISEKIEETRTQFKARIEAEAKVNEARAAEIARIKAAELEAQVKAAQDAKKAREDAAAAANPKVADETPAEEPAEEPVEETTEETPATEE